MWCEKNQNTFEIVGNDGQRCERNGAHKSSHLIHHREGAPEVGDLVLEESPAGDIP